MRVNWLLLALIVPAASRAQSTAAATTHRRPAPSAAASADSASGIPFVTRALAPVDDAPLTTAPGGRVIASLDSTARVQVLARERGWTRVRLEGWVRSGQLIPGSASRFSALSAADLRADPEAARGQLVRWRVQVYALRTADPLRRDLAPDEPYLLAKGPERERALLYLAIPPSLLSTARAIEPLSWVTVTARVRAGRSDPSGVPILDVQSITQR